MNFQTFHNEMKEYPLITTRDITKLPEKVYYHRLIEWQKKGYLVRLGKNIFSFADKKIDDHLLMLTANKMYSPSYISLEMALSFYNLIPETVYTYTSVSPKKTTVFSTPFGNFSYRKIKSQFMFGYDLKRYDNFVIRIAEPEKAILDFLYLNPRFDSTDEIHELRINQYEFRDLINMEKIEAYLRFIDSKSLCQRFKLLNDWISNA
jgi:predicted transcriptional regulator of viral defense system